MDDILSLLLLACLCPVISTQSDVRLPPTLTRWPQGKTLMYSNGSKFTLKCGADGTPAVRYEWKKNGSPLSTNLSSVLKKSGGKITINRTTEMDEGYYQCFAQNQYGTALSNMIHVRMIFSEDTPGYTVLRRTVVEGMSFRIQANRLRCYPEPRFEWCTATRVDERSSRYDPVKYSERIQIAENGDLHFAYALAEDGSGGRLYECTHSFFPYFAIYTRIFLTVIRNSTGNISQFAPTLAFSSAAFDSETRSFSEAKTAAVVGGSIKLKCFFYGFPEPTISWRGSTNMLPTRRHRLLDFNTTLVLHKVVASDEGNYSCIASNAQGDKKYTFHILVGVEPNFTRTEDGPYNVNVTVGQSVTFNCNALAKPEANIVWLQNGQPVDTGNPPKRFVFSNDLKSLTIRDVCRDCIDRESKTDLMVIQCNASNVHGYAFAQGYLNVLSESGSRQMVHRKWFTNKWFTDKRLTTRGSRQKVHDNRFTTKGSRQKVHDNRFTTKGSLKILNFMKICRSVS